MADAIAKAEQNAIRANGGKAIDPNALEKLRKETARIAEKTYGEAVKYGNAGAAAGAVASRAATQPPGEPSVFDGAAGRGRTVAAGITGAQPQASTGFGVPEGKVGDSDNPLTATLGGSNLGKVFGGGQRTVVIQQAPEQAGQAGKKEDLPPPRG